MPPRREGGGAGGGAGGCDVCGVSYTSATDRDEHLSGKRHRRAVAAAAGGRRGRAPGHTRSAAGGGKRGGKRNSGAAAAAPSPDADAAAPPGAVEAGWGAEDEWDEEEGGGGGSESDVYELCSGMKVLVRASAVGYPRPTLRPGDYVTTARETSVTKTLEIGEGAAEVAVLPEGTPIRVIEVVHCGEPAVHRVRGRVRGGRGARGVEGWASLEDAEGGFRWVRGASDADEWAGAECRMQSYGDGTWTVTLDDDPPGSSGEYGSRIRRGVRIDDIRLAPLRFRAGDEVLANMAEEGWLRGAVVRVHFCPGRFGMIGDYYPYQIRLHERGGGCSCGDDGCCDGGRLIQASADNDDVVRAADNPPPPMPALLVARDASDVRAAVPLSCLLRRGVPPAHAAAALAYLPRQSRWTAHLLHAFRSEGPALPPLHWAVRSGAATLAHLLILAGAGPDEMVVPKTFVVSVAREVRFADPDGDRSCFRMDGETLVWTVEAGEAAKEDFGRIEHRGRLEWDPECCALTTTGVARSRRGGEHDRPAGTWGLRFGEWTSDGREELEACWTLRTVDAAAEEGGAGHGAAAGCDAAGGAPLRGLAPPLMHACWRHAGGFCTTAGGRAALRAMMTPRALNYEDDERWKPVMRAMYGTPPDVPLAKAVAEATAALPAGVFPAGDLAEALRISYWRWGAFEGHRDGPAAVAALVTPAVIARGLHTPGGPAVEAAAKLGYRRIMAALAAAVGGPVPEYTGERAGDGMTGAGAYGCTAALQLSIDQMRADRDGGSDDDGSAGLDP